MNENGFLVAHLNQEDSIGLDQIKKAFDKANPGYLLDYVNNIRHISSSSHNRMIFIQSGGGTATLNNGKYSKFSIGDIIVLDENDTISSDSLFSCLIFQIPEKPSNEIPKFIRPDWDQNITDTPGGCATETNAYRRILLTWKEDVGKYIYHGLNAHRVRIMDSFSHYHPIKGGFDEFYLVQMALPDARIITSNKVGDIETKRQLTRTKVPQLLDETHLHVGDLVYLPRGVMHRGLGGVLAQVITIPGFIPGAEIGVDHHLKEINDKFELTENQRLPYNREASGSPIIK